MSFNLTRSVGPAIGGAIVAASGAAAAFAVNALQLYRAHHRAVPLEAGDAGLDPAARAAGPRDLGAGLRYVAMSPNIEKVLLRGFVFGLTAISTLALLPLVARDIIQGGPLLYGVLLGAFGIGAIGGAFLGGRLRGMIANEWIARIGFVAFALSATIQALSDQRLADLHRAADRRRELGAGACRSSTSRSSFRRRAGWSAAPCRSTRWRPSAAWRWAAGSGASSPKATARRKRCSPRRRCMLVGAALGLFIKLPEHAALNLDPLNRWREPQSGAGPQAAQRDRSSSRSNTSSASEDLHDFLDAMAERRRIRRRDGARQLDADARPGEP